MLTQGIGLRLFPLPGQLLFQLGDPFAEGPLLRSSIVLHVPQLSLGDDELPFLDRELLAEFHDDGRLAGSGLLDEGLSGRQLLDKRPAILHPLLDYPKLLGLGNNEPLLLGDHAFALVNHVPQINLARRRGHPSELCLVAGGVHSRDCRLQLGGTSGRDGLSESVLGKRRQDGTQDTGSDESKDVEVVELAFNQAWQLPVVSNYRTQL